MLALLGVAIAAPLVLGLIFTAPQPDPRRAIGYMETGCTAEFIRPTLLMTAAHCMEEKIWMWSLPGEPGKVFKIEFTDPDGRKTVLEAKLVWVSDRRPESQTEDGLDIAFLTVRDPWPYVLKFETRPLTGFPIKGRNISMALGLKYWDVTLDLVGYFEVAELGHVLVVRGDTAPGSSGSVVLVSGKIVSMITHGTRGLLIPPLHIGATAKRILGALADLDRYGEMYVCKKVEICRGRAPE